MKRPSRYWGLAWARASRAPVMGAPNWGWDNTAHPAAMTAPTTTASATVVRNSKRASLGFMGAPMLMGYFHPGVIAARWKSPMPYSCAHNLRRPDVQKDACPDPARCGRIGRRTELPATARKHPGGDACTLATHAGGQPDGPDSAAGVLGRIPLNRASLDSIPAP